MLYLSRFAAVLVVFIALILALIAFPFISVVYICSGVDLSEKILPRLKNPI